MKSILVLACGLILGGNALATTEVTCFDGDCWSAGWTTTDLDTGKSSTAVCVNSDCSQGGWITEFEGREVARVYCKNEDCFNEGWQVIDTQKQTLAADVSCMHSYVSSDCFSNGWTTQIPGQGSYNTYCTDGDCRLNGWEVSVPGYRPQVVQCKEGGCFEEGWTVE